MNLLDSECSSGCESGWTLYLEQSFLSPSASLTKPSTGFQAKNSGSNFSGHHDKQKGFEEEEEEEEDLSMVSDASSGPPLLQHDFHHESDDNQVVHLNHDHYHNKSSKSSGKKRQNMKDQQQQPSFLDDTASSPLCNFSNNMEQDFALTNMKQGRSMESVLDYSQRFSATHFQGRSAVFQDPFRPFLHSSLSGNQLHEMSGLKGVRRWK